jgi:hypothetical protein
MPEVRSSACFRTNDICASENFDAFMEISFSRARDHKWKIPAQNGPILREQINYFLICDPNFLRSGA